MGIRRGYPPARQSPRFHPAFAKRPAELPHNIPPERNAMLPHESFLIALFESLGNNVNGGSSSIADILIAFGIF